MSPSTTMSEPLLPLDLPQTGSSHLWPTPTGSWTSHDKAARNAVRRRTSKTVSYCSDIDLICGGFPCQDISVAGKGAGIGGSRSGLWTEYARIIGEVRPRYVIVENVAALLDRGLERVLGDLAALGYDAEWHCIPASAVGAPHRRDRVWIVAYAHHATNHRRNRAAAESEAAELRNTINSIRLNI